MQIGGRKYFDPLEKMEEKILFNEKSIISKWIANMYEQEINETDDVEFLLSLIGRPQKRILEVCCGSGRILVPLAKAGHRVSGFDADMYMLGKIPAKAEGLSNIEWQKADAVHSDWGTGFDVVVLAGNILFNIVSDMDYEKAQELLIRKAASALVPGGYVYIEYQPGGHKLKQRGESNKDSDDLIVWEGNDCDGNYGKMTLIAGAYDSHTQPDTFTRRFELKLKNGEKIQQDIPCVKHFASLDQVHKWLSNNGFIIDREYEDYNQNPINENSGKVIIYAKKG